MRKVIAALNMTIDGVCDHTAGSPNDQIHQHYTTLLGQGDVILYGRITYQLMEFWRSFLEHPSQEKSMNDFAIAIDKIPKIVFSHSLTSVDWETATIANRELKDVILELKKQTGRSVNVGSRSLIIQLLKLDLIDECQLCIYPLVEGNGMRLFENLNDSIVFKLLKTKTFNNGAFILYYLPIRN